MTEKVYFTYDDDGYFIETVASEKKPDNATLTAPAF